MSHLCSKPSPVPALPDSRFDQDSSTRCKCPAHLSCHSSLLTLPPLLEHTSLHTERPMSWSLSLEGLPPLSLANPAAVLRVLFNASSKRCSPTWQANESCVPLTHQTSPSEHFPLFCYCRSVLSASCETQENQPITIMKKSTNWPAAKSKTFLT